MTTSTRDAITNRRLASSVWLPWFVGLALLLLLATVLLLFGGRVETGRGIPTAVTDAQRSLTASTAQQVRKGVNEGVYDLEQFADTLSAAGDVDPATLPEALGRLEEVHGRYLSLFVVDETGSVVAAVGAKPSPDLLPAAVEAPGMLDAVLHDDVEVILQFAPLAGPSGEVWVVAGTYDPRFLTYPLQTAAPAPAWIVNDRGQVLASTVSAAAFQTLDRAALREAASKAGSSAGADVGEGTVEAQEVVAWAPVSGLGPAGGKGWGVVTARSLSTITLPETEARRQGVAAGLVLLLFTAGIFAWLYAAVLRPLQALRADTERLAYGDLRMPVEIRREDEIGEMARSLERIRLSLVRQRGRSPGEVEASAESDR